MSITDRLDEIESVADYLDDPDLESEVHSATAALRAVLAVHWYDAENEGCGDCRTFAVPCDTQRAVAEALGVAP